MVFDFDRKALVVGVEGRALGDGPGFEDAVEFEPQVVMQVRCCMLLNDEAEALRGLDFRVSAGLGRFGEIAFGAVLCEQLFDHERHRQYWILTELKVPGSVKVPTAYGGSKWRLVPIGRAR